MRKYNIQTISRKISSSTVTAEDLPSNLQAPADIVGVDWDRLSQSGRTAAGDQIDHVKAVENPDGTQNNQQSHDDSDMGQRDMEEGLER